MSKIPSWLIFLLLFAFLYFTGLHKEVIAQLQKVILYTGIKDADIPQKLDEDTSHNHKVGEGFSMKKLGEGEEILFDQFHGKVVFLNLWATWCPPCKAEMPSIQALYEDINSAKIEFVMLSLDKGGEQKVEEFITDNSYSFPVFIPLDQLPREFQSTGIPATYIISPKGNILYNHTGIANYNTEEVKDFLLQLTK